MKNFPPKSNSATDPNNRFWYAEEANSLFDELENLVTAVDGGNFTLDENSTSQVKDSVLAMITRAIISFQTATGVGGTASSDYGSNLNIYRPGGIYTFSNSATPNPGGPAAGLLFVLRGTSNTDMIQLAITRQTGATTQASTYVRYCFGGTGNTGSAPTTNLSWRKLFFSEDTSAAITSALTAVGLGVASLSGAATDLNTVLSSGLVRTSSSTLNRPGTSDSYAVITMAGTNDGSATAQLAIDLTTNGMLWTRRRLSGTWGPWDRYSNGRLFFTSIYTSSDTLALNETRIVRYNTSGGPFTLTLPTGYSTGDKLTFMNCQYGLYEGQGINQLSIQPSGTDLIDLDTSAFIQFYLPSFSMVYDASVPGWVFMEQ